MASPTTPRALKWYWGPPTKNGAQVTINTVQGGAVMYGFILSNTAAAAMVVGFFDPPTPTTAPDITQLVIAFPMAATGQIMILPEEFPIAEFRKNFNWYVWNGSDTSILGTGANAGLVSLQLAYA